MASHSHNSVRRALAEHTRTAHETLHHHPWIGCLISPTLTQGQYFSVLNAYLQFYRRIEDERNRLGVFESLNLSDAVTNLQSDTFFIDEAKCQSTKYEGITLDSAGSVLGALYVLHGARFGAAILNKQVSVSLPAVPRQFLQNTTPKQQWRELTDAIESLATNKSAQQDMFLSADLTFSSFGESVTEFCESMSVENYA